MFGYAAALCWLLWSLATKPLVPSKRPKYWLGSLVAGYAMAFYASLIFFSPQVTEAWIIASQVTHWLIFSHIIVVAVTSDHG